MYVSALAALAPPTIQKLCGHSVLHSNSVSNGGEDGPKGSIAGDLFCKPGKFVVLSVASLLPIFGGLVST